MPRSVGNRSSSETRHVAASAPVMKNRRAALACDMLLMDWRSWTSSSEHNAIGRAARQPRRFSARNRCHNRLEFRGLRSGSLPRQQCRGLIEARRWQEVKKMRFDAFRGSNAAASLKPPASWPKRTPVGSLPRQQCRGLIEARQCRWHRPAGSWPSAAAMPRPH